MAFFRLKRALSKTGNFFRSGVKSRGKLMREIVNQQKFIEETDEYGRMILDRHDKDPARLISANPNLSIDELKRMRKNELQKLNRTLNNELADKGLDKKNIDKVQRTGDIDIQEKIETSINAAREAYLKEWERKFFESDVYEYGEMMDEDRKEEVWKQIEGNITAEFNDGWRPRAFRSQARGTSLNRYNTIYKPKTGIFSKWKR